MEETKQVRPFKTIVAAYGYPAGGSPLYIAGNVETKEEAQVIVDKAPGRIIKNNTGIGWAKEWRIISAEIEVHDDRKGLVIASCNAVEEPRGAMSIEPTMTEREATLYEDIKALHAALNSVTALFVAYDGFDYSCVDKALQALARHPELPIRASLADRKPRFDEEGQGDDGLIGCRWCGGLNCSCMEYMLLPEKAEEAK